jgi:hypothetical protein
MFTTTGEGRCPAAATTDGAANERWEDFEVDPPRSRRVTHYMMSLEGVYIYLRREVKNSRLLDWGHTDCARPAFRRWMRSSCERATEGVNTHTLGDFHRSAEKGERR